jgi:hypothetical protein
MFETKPLKGNHPMAPKDIDSLLADFRSTIERDDNADAAWPRWRSWRMGCSA